MISEKLYRVQKEDLPKLLQLLTICFAEDPLYQALIPDKETRERLQPELFSCDLTEFFETCVIYTDSPELTVFWWFPMNPSLTACSTIML